MKSGDKGKKNLQKRQVSKKVAIRARKGGEKMKKIR